MKLLQLQEAKYDEQERPQRFYLYIEWDDPDPEGLEDEDYDDEGMTSGVGIRPEEYMLEIITPENKVSLRDGIKQIQKVWSNNFLILGNYRGSHINDAISEFVNRTKQTNTDRSYFYQEQKHGYNSIKNAYLVCWFRYDI